MSEVTNVILHFSICENEDWALAAVNEFFDEGEKPFVSLEDDSLPSGWYGGRKGSEAPLFYGAFNYLDLEDLIDHMRQLDFRYREDVQLIVCGQHEQRFRIINVLDDGPRSLVSCGSPVKIFVSRWFRPFDRAVERCFVSAARSPSFHDLPQAGTTVAIADDSRETQTPEQIDNLKEDMIQSSIDSLKVYIHGRGWHGDIEIVRNDKPEADVIKEAD